MLSMEAPVSKSILWLSEALCQGQEIKEAIDAVDRSAWLSSCGKRMNVHWARCQGNTIFPKSFETWKAWNVEIMPWLALKCR